MKAEYADVISELDQAIVVENDYNASVDEVAKSGLKDLKRKFDEWVTRLPVISFNGGFYDLNLLEKHLIPLLLNLNENLSPIKRGNSFMIIYTPELSFLDLRNYLAPSYSLALFLNHYGASEVKGSFPYETVEGVDDLHKPGLPSQADFYSTLRGSTISNEDYDVVKRTWNAHGMYTLFDLLKWYSLLDVRPF